MNPVNVPAFTTPIDGYKVYQKFRGIDLLTDETQIDDSRSPWAVNLISDAGGYPEKRLGWRTVHRFTVPEKQSAQVNGIWPFTLNGKDQIIVHVGARLVRLDPRAEGYAETVLMSGLNDARSTGFYFGGDLWVLTGNDFLHYDGEKAVHVTDEAYIPTTSTGAKPTGGGQSYEAANLIGKRRKNTFIPDGTAKTFTVDTGKIDAGSTVKAWNNGKEITKGITFDPETGKVTFETAPEKPAAAGTATLTIEFAKTTEGAADKILKCRIFTMFGVNNSTRVFLSGNPDFPATEWYSSLSSARYWPDNQNIQVGTQDFSIVAYAKYQGELLVLKEDNRQEITVWNHTAEFSSTGTAVFPLKESLGGLGAVGSFAVQTLLDDPLFLTPRGVFAPVTSYAYPAAQRSLQGRSDRINPRLVKEKNLQDAISAVWQGYYILALNGHAYVADSNQSRDKNGYEWYYWDGIPARCMSTQDDVLYFGTDDGRLCRLNNDLVDETGDRLMAAYSDDGAAIHWEWRSKLDDLKYPTRYKTLHKRGNGVQLKAFTRSSCEIWLRTEKDFGQKVDTPEIDVFSFNDVDFGRFTFSGLDVQEIIFKKKLKKFLFVQIILKGAELNEGFGIYSAALHYNIGSYAKRKKRA